MVARCGEMKLREMLQGARCDRRRFQLASEEAEAGGKEGEIPCPICSVEVSELLRVAEYPAVIPMVQEEFPGWLPEEGLCETCLERYESRRNSGQEAGTRE